MIEFYTQFCHGDFQSPEYSYKQCERERKKKKKKKAQARLKQETKIPLIHVLYGILLLNDFELFYAR